jgi:hypothetical protein
LNERLDQAKARCRQAILVAYSFWILTLHGNM